jgi:hypothetical protein
MSSFKVSMCIDPGQESRTVRGGLMYQNWLSIYSYVTEHQKEILRDVQREHDLAWLRAERKRAQKRREEASPSIESIKPACQECGPAA